MQIRISLRAAGALVFAACLIGHAAAHRVVDPLEATPAAPAQASPVEVLSGQLHHLTIDDRVAGMVVDAYMLRLDDGRGMSLKSDQVAGLRTGDRVTVTGRRNGKAIFASDVQRVAGPSAGARGANARAATLRGKLALFHVDAFEEERSEFLFEVQDATGKGTTLDLPIAPEALQKGMRVTVTGELAQDGASISPDSVTIEALPSEPKALITTTNKALVILMTFTDSPAVPFTPAQVQSVFAGGAGSGSVTEYFKEASYGQQLLNATITNWLPTNAATPVGCDWRTMATLGRNAAAAAGYSVTSFQNVVYVFPKVAACGWIGLGYVGASGVWINGRNQTSVYAHELGHNFGLLHAASLRCGTATIGGSCSVSEYGDPFGVMGNQSAMHYNAMQKDALAWIPGGSVITHGTGTATYVLSPLELAGGTTYAVKVPAKANRTYWLEYRQPIGFDAGLANYPNNGAQVRVASPFETLCAGCDAYSDDTQLLDMTPGTATFTDAALTVGNSFTDSTFGITFNVVSATSTALTVQVTTAGSAATSTSLASSANPSQSGAAVTFTATVNGTAPTGTVTFKDGSAAIAGCNGVALAGSGNSKTAACSTGALVAGTHAITASYGGDAANAASSSGTLNQTVNGLSGSLNVALAANGGVASASSSDVGYPVASVNNGERAGAGSGNRWRDATANVFPDWVQISFSGSKTIDRVVVYSVQDNYTSPVEPTDTKSFSLYGLRDFTIQGWNGSAWVILGSVTGNTLVKRTVSFAAFVTDRIRINVTQGLASYSRMTEIEAWGTGVAAAPSATVLASSANPSQAGTSVTFTATVDGTLPTGSVTFKEGSTILAGCDAVALSGTGNSRTATCSTSALVAGTHSISASYGGDAGNAPSSSGTLSQAVDSVSVAINVALASNGGVASASSSDFGYPVASVNNNERAGAGSGNRWRDATPGAYPDWVQIDFAGSKTIDRVIVFSVQDNYTSPVEPTDTAKFSLYGLRDFTVQGWNGSAWITLAAVTGNNLVKRTVSFTAFTTDRIRISATQGLASYSRITEIEAWGG